MQIICSGIRQCRRVFPSRVISCIFLRIQCINILSIKYNESIKDLLPLLIRILGVLSPLYSYFLSKADSLTLRV